MRRFQWIAGDLHVSDKMSSFIPNRELAMEAVRLQVLSLAYSSAKTKIITFFLFGGFLLPVNLLRELLRDDVTAMQWIGAALASPLFVVIGNVLQYAIYRFARPITILDDGVIVLPCGPLLKYWKPVECRIDKFKNSESIYIFSVQCTNWLNRSPYTVYSGLTDDLDSAIDFIDEFNAKCRKC